MRPKRLSKVLILILLSNAVGVALAINLAEIEYYWRDITILYSEYRPCVDVVLRWLNF